MWASSSLTPSALKTYEGSKDELVHADPELIATYLTAINKLSPSTKANEIFKLPLNLYFKSPLYSIWVKFLLSLSIIYYYNFLI